MTYKKAPKNAENFLCETCNFKCSKKSDYNRHLLTAKHKILTNTPEKTPKNATFDCECGKSYKHRQSLNSHKKKCMFEISNNITENVCELAVKKDEIIVKEEEIDYKNLLMDAMKQMQEQQEEMKKKDLLMANMIDKIGNTTNNISNTNFNINMFLNEKCKDAINFSDFIDRIEISHDDLENNAQLGFVNGITKILIDNLNQLTLYERPIHCTDQKRDTLYIKDDNKWEKEQSDKKIENAIQQVSRKSIGSLLEWKKENPEYENIDSDFSNQCIAIQKESIAGCKKDSYYPKIKHNIAKENTIKYK
tara:strand:- start:688 stop:1605 length:918 start_codon:yes stop_codon:yes gene_type:complete